ncbi:MAG: DUF202 domain-containing protein [Asgard group archaeon]|nr:DUF202 domain-containing protein [Asgard group archaeon]
MRFFGNEEENTDNEEQQENLFMVDRDELIIRDHLAADRTALANERTFLAYLRTAIALAGAGFGLIKFVDETAYIIIGWILIPIATVILIYGILHYIRFKSSISFMGAEYHIEKKSSDEKFEE